MSAELVVLDTETGGLDVRKNPLLSISMLAVRADGLAETARLHLKILPPDGTLCEHTQDTDPENFKPLITHLTDVNGKVYDCAPNGTPLDPVYAENARISAGAARVNGFTWASWSDTGMQKEEADATFTKFVLSECIPKPMAWAHNADFDEKYLFYHLPRSHDLLQTPWYCTMKLLKTWRKRSGIQGRNRLKELAALANEDPDTPAYQTLNLKSGGTMLDNAHDALADTILCHAGLIWLTAKLAPQA